MASSLPGPAPSRPPPGDGGSGTGGPGAAPDAPGGPERGPSCRKVAGRVARAAGSTVLSAVVAVAALVVAAAAPGAAAAQEGSVHLDAGLSHSLAPSGSPVDPSTYGLAGLRLDWSPGARSRLFGGAYGALSFDDAAGEWGSVSAGFDLWTPAGETVTLGLGGRGQAFTVGAPFEYRAVEGELRPRIGIRLGRAWLTLAGRAGVGTSEVAVRDVPELPDDVTPTGEVSTDLWYWGGGPELTLPAGPMSVTLAGHAFDARNGAYREGRVSLDGEAGPVTLSVDLAVWDTPGDEEVTGGITLRVPLGSRSSVNAAARRADPDPLLGTPASAQGSFTTSVRLARLGPPPERPLYRVDRRGTASTPTVTFTLRRPDADEVVVLGDFTGWEPVPMERRDGVWEAELEVEPGVHHFGFRVDGEWFVPEDAPGRIPDDWGRTNATLVVRR